ncbi:hypothetical protein [Agriterribacter sp.]|uniref:hypothetical protein n=1 Tax=Agriterribacter sp. TaxID=2821509 RepID=UPI002C72B2D6|nr:hypothetical protein [Agriterribacter sp.]HTN07775.1 hypothetical protein [Agriterribacter sp.]
MAIYGIYKPKYHAREKNRQNAMLKENVESIKYEIRKKIRRNTAGKHKEPKSKNQKKSNIKSEDKISKSEDNNEECGER